jgi:ATP-binding cassette, subfamily B, bacterial HlyB/CyaB
MPDSLEARRGELRFDAAPPVTAAGASPSPAAAPAPSAAPEPEQGAAAALAAAAPSFTLSPRHTALRALFIVALQAGVHLKPEDFAEFTDADAVGAVLNVMHAAGLEGTAIEAGNWRKLLELDRAYPVMAQRNDGFWLVVVSTIEGPDGPSVAIVDPKCEERGIALVPRGQFLAEWSGLVVTCRRRLQRQTAERRFGLGWFLPDIRRQRRYLLDVSLMAAVSIVISFSTPLMFQLLIDKVITHHSYQTLATLMVIFCVLAGFDAIFSYTRQYLMILVTNKIDARLSSRSFKHLVSLPLAFFEAATAGVVARNLLQTETIRGFLTGRLFQVMLDAMALPLMLAMLVLYSPRLTLVVLGFSSAIAAVIGIMIPTFRRRLQELYYAEGSRQAHLVETIHGMHTVKSLALENVQLARWEDRLAAGISCRAIVGRIAAIANVLTQSLDKLMQIAVLGLGSVSVFDGDLSLGALVAFNIIAGRVTGPLVQIVALINEYQQVALSVRMLGTIMQHPPERDPAQGSMAPPISGRLEFDQVGFSYAGQTARVLDRVSFTVEAGQIVGVVGRSGSGKTTLTRLIQGIETASEGVIRIDGTDIRHVDLTHLRRSIGVVLQDNFLLRGTIRENIAAARPDTPLDEIVAAARVAGADEFIDRLPRSYETMIEENGANLSGGQRQRLAIARALLVHPRLLIFDEATSALDPESEAIFQQNLADIARGRTLIIVSHRLTSLTRADGILVLDRGQVIDFAPHPVLVERCEAYRRLWQQQTKFLR